MQDKTLEAQSPSGDVRKPCATCGPGPDYFDAVCYDCGRGIDGWGRAFGDEAAPPVGFARTLQCRPRSISLPDGTPDDGGVGYGTF